MISTSLKRPRAGEIGRRCGRSSRRRFLKSLPGTSGAKATSPPPACRPWEVELKIQVRFFAGLARRAGCRESFVQVSPKTDGDGEVRIADALSAIEQEFPTLASMLSRV